MKLPDQRLNIEPAAPELVVQDRTFFDKGIRAVMAATCAWIAVGLLVVGAHGWWAAAFEVAAAALAAPSLIAWTRAHRALLRACGSRLIDMALDIFFPIVIAALDVIIYIALFMFVISLCANLKII